jgi:hypothetical protein
MRSEGSLPKNRPRRRSRYRLFCEWRWRKNSHGGNGGHGGFWVVFHQDNLRNWGKPIAIGASKLVRVLQLLNSCHSFPHMFLRFCRRGGNCFAAEPRLDDANKFFLGGIGGRGI